MAITSVQLLAEQVTPAVMNDVGDVLTANPGTFTAQVDGFDGDLADYTDMAGLTCIFEAPWSAAKTTALTALVAALD